MASGSYKKPMKSDRRYKNMSVSRYPNPGFVFAVQKEVLYADPSVLNMPPHEQHYRIPKN